MRSSRADAVTPAPAASPAGRWRSWARRRSGPRSHRRHKADPRHARGRPARCGRPGGSSRWRRGAGAGRGRRSVPAVIREPARREVAEVGAGAAAEVETTRDGAQARGEARGKPGVARRVVDGSRSASQSAIEAAHAVTPIGSSTAKARAASAQPGRCARGRAGASASRARSSGSVDQPAQRRGERAGASPGGTSRPASAGTVSGMAPARGRDDRQAARERLGQRHAVALVVGGEHEQVGARRRAARAPVSPARRAARRAARARARRSRRRIARAQAGSRSALPTQVRRQARSRKPASASSSTRWPLRGVSEATQSSDGPARPSRAASGAGSVPGSDHARSAIGVDARRPRGRARSRAGHDRRGAARGEQRALESRRSAAASLGDQAGLERQRMMDRAPRAAGAGGSAEPGLGEAPAARGRRSRQRRPSGHARRSAARAAARRAASSALGKAPASSCTSTVRPERAQTFDDPPVVDVAAGELVERARHDEVQRRVIALQRPRSSPRRRAIRAASP